MTSTLSYKRSQLLRDRRINIIAKFYFSDRIIDDIVIRVFEVVGVHAHLSVNPGRMTRLSIEVTDGIQFHICFKCMPYFIFVI